MNDKCKYNMKDVRPVTQSVVSSVQMYDYLNR